LISIFNTLFLEKEKLNVTSRPTYLISEKLAEYGAP
jgi:hypothetical protein